MLLSLCLRKCEVEQQFREKWPEKVLSIRNTRRHLWPHPTAPNYTPHDWLMEDLEWPFHCQWMDRRHTLTNTHSDTHTYACKHTGNLYKETHLRACWISKWWLSDITHETEMQNPLWTKRLIFSWNGSFKWVSP